MEGLWEGINEREPLGGCKVNKEKIIENPRLFRNIYENKVKGKQIHIVIHQPKIL